MEDENLIKLCHETFIKDTYSWVLFTNGTVVFLDSSAVNLENDATELLKRWGPVHGGGPGGDFSIINMENHLGWIVTCHHNDILTLVRPNELENKSPEHVEVGLFGRGKRDKDAKELSVLAIEDKRENMK